MQSCGLSSYRIAGLLNCQPRPYILQTIASNHVLFYISLNRIPCLKRLDYFIRTPYRKRKDDKIRHKWLLEPDESIWPNLRGKQLPIVWQTIHWGCLFWCRECPVIQQTPVGCLEYKAPHHMVCKQQLFSFGCSIENKCLRYPLRLT